MKTVILVNVGTPQSAEPEDVGLYLREFLMDENILPLARPFRDLLVKGWIVPRRKFSSSHKYKNIWTEKGSPLLVESQLLVEKLQSRLGPGWQVRLGMQVGKPSLREALEEAAQVSEEIYFCPLYPQFATATTGGAVKVLQKKLRKQRSVKVFELGPFYSQPWFWRAQADLIRKRWQPGDHLLLSYHGLPVSQLVAHRSACDSPSGCCERENACLENCYKAQCLRTSQLLRQELGFERVTIGFQSRLGRGRWIEPSTESQVQSLLREGVRHLKVACPSFVADCLETLEEIGLDLKSQFLKGGGESFELVPCVNSHDLFVEGLASVLRSRPEYLLLRSLVRA